MHARLARAETQTAVNTYASERLSSGALWGGQCSTSNAVPCRPSRLTFARSSSVRGLLVLMAGLLMMGMMDSKGCMHTSLVIIVQVWTSIAWTTRQLQNLKAGRASCEGECRCTVLMQARHLGSPKQH